MQIPEAQFLIINAHLHRKMKGKKPRLGNFFFGPPNLKILSPSLTYNIGHFVLFPSFVFWLTLTIVIITESLALWNIEMRYDYSAISRKNSSYENGIWLFLVWMHFIFGSNQYWDHMTQHLGLYIKISLNFNSVVCKVGVSKTFPILHGVYRMTGHLQSPSRCFFFLPRK